MNQPKIGQDIVVRCVAYDDVALQTVRLLFQRNQNPTDSIQLYDDGLHLDQLPNDGIFGNRVAGLNSPGMFAYNIRATDNTGKSKLAFCINRAPIINQYPTLIVNELVADNTNYPDNFGEFDDWIEIYNASPQTISLANKFLTDDFQVPNKWQMPNISIAPNQFLLFWADNQTTQGMNHTNFKISKSGEQIGIYEQTSPNVFTLIDTLTFGMQSTNVAFGSMPDANRPALKLPSATPNQSNMIVGVETLEQKNNLINIYPNPAQTTVQISLKQHRFAEIKSIEIFNILGNKTKHIVKPDSKQIDINELEKGLYFLNVTFENGQQLNAKFIKD